MTYNVGVHEVAQQTVLKAISYSRPVRWCIEGRGFQRTQILE